MMTHCCGVPVGRGFEPVMWIVHRLRVVAGRSDFRNLFKGFWPGVMVAVALHIVALVRIAQTEFGPFGQGLCLLTWILLNAVLLLIVRRAALAAALSLGLIELLILVSQFKFKIT